MKKLLTKLILSGAFLGLFYSESYGSNPWPSGSDPSASYCNAYESDGKCGLDRGIEIVGSGVENIEQKRRFSVYSQDMVAYLMGFVALLGVIYIIYAGFIITTSSGDDGRVKKAKTSITFVLMGIIVMFLAYSIIKWIIGVANTGNNNTTSYNFELPSIIQKTYASSMNDNGTYDQYKKEILSISNDLKREYEVDEKLSLVNLNRLERAVKGAMETFPESENSTNENFANNLLISIEKVKKSLSSDNKINELASKINDFIRGVKIPRISAKIAATPQTGNAPLSVSLRAIDAVDPSGVTIPNNNYVWSIKRPDQSYEPIGYGPSIYYVFRDEKSYVVNLDIKSASRNKYGKTNSLPFSSSIQLNVLPSAGNIHFYINGINVTDLEKLKITPNIGKAGLILDATASLPRGNSKFIKTIWEFGNGNTTSYDSSPRLEKQYYATEGNYRILLKLKTNEDREITKELSLEVRDPIASIKVDKKEGFVGEDFKFNVNTAFVQSRLNYNWMIRDLSNDSVLYTSNNENISYKFKKTGDYAVVLKSISPSNAQDTDTIKIKIEAREPVGSLDISQASSQTPNTFKFDASSSFDPDTYDGSKLEFVWTIDGNRVELDDSSRNGAIGKYTFTTEGNHKIVLDITNKDGKSTQIKRDLEVKSLLSVKLNFSPKIVKIGSTVNIVAESKEANAFEWSFGDGNKETTNNGRINHQYKKSGEYDIYLTVRGGKSGNSNSISKKIYVSDGINPTAYIGIKDNGEEVLPTSGACDGEDAYVINRAQSFNFYATDSINADGSNNGLSYSWKYLGKNSSQQQFSYKFDELGCFPISLTVKSQKTGNLDTNTIYVKVENIPPKISGLTVTASDINADPVVVKVTANNPKDEDGVIVNYLWYYYTDSDPEPQDYRITKGPSTTFVIPRVSGKYNFALSVEDSNGAKINTEETSSEKYSIQLATDNINTPIIKLNANKTSIGVGDEINFEVLVNDILGKNISDKVEYKWDFDGDGFYDETGKNPKITHKFNTPGNINFKVKVSYKGISNTKYQLISVKNTLKPDLEYYSIGKKLVLFNTTKGLFTKANWDLGDSVIGDNKDYFVYDFSDRDFPTSVNLKVSDGQASKTVDFPIRKDLINYKKIEKSSEKLQIFTYPEINDDTINIKNPGDKLFVYLGESKGNINKYCIDIDTNSDGDLNGTKDDDCDNKGTDSYDKGAPFVINDFSSQTQKRKIRLSIFDGTNKIDSKDINVIIGYAKSVEVKEVEISGDISEKDKEGIERLKDLIKTASDRDRLQMMQFLNTLQENWFDQREKMKSIIDFESYVENSDLDSKQKEQFVSILEGFIVKDDQIDNEVTRAATAIKSLIPKSNSHYNEIVGTQDKPGKIDEILSHPTNVTLNKELGKTILEWIKDDTNISDKDKLIIKSQLQVIIYGSQEAIPDTVKNEDPEYQKAVGSSGILGFVSGFVKIFGAILLLILGGFIVLLVMFKIGNKNDNLSFQDYLIDKFGGGRREDKKFGDFNNVIKPNFAKNDVLDSIKQTNLSNVEPIITQKTDPNLNVNTPKKQDDVLKNLTNTGTKTDLGETKNTVSSVPDWLKGSSTTSNTFTSVDNKKDDLPKISNTDTDKSQDLNKVESTKKDDLEAPISTGLPDWLKPKDNIQEKNDSNKTTENVGNSEKLDTKTREDVDNKDANTLPDWLKGSSDLGLKKEEENKDSDKLLSEKKIKDEEINNSGDVPDWFKGLNKDDLNAEIKDELNIQKSTSLKEKQSLPQQKTDKKDGPIIKNSDIKPDTKKENQDKNMNTQKQNKPNYQQSEGKEKTQVQNTEIKKEIPQKKQEPIITEKVVTNKQEDSNLPDWLKGLSEDGNAKKDNIDKGKQKLKSESQDLDFNLDFLGSDMFNSEEKNQNISDNKKGVSINTSANQEDQSSKKDEEKDFSKAKKIDTKPPKKEENLLKKEDDNLPDWLK